MCSNVTSPNLHQFDFTERPDGSVSSEDAHSDVVTASFAATTERADGGGVICRPFRRRQLTPLEVAIELTGVERLLLRVDVNLEIMVHEYIFAKMNKINKA